MSADRPTVCVHGLWHQGIVTAACFAHLGVRVLATDTEAATVRRVAAGNYFIDEPTLDDLIAAGRDAGRLDFFTAEQEAIVRADVLWIAPDVEVDEQDRGDSDPVVARAIDLAGHLRPDGLLVLACQTPVGTARHVWMELARRYPDRRLRVAVVPENLRLGEAVHRFLEPQQVIVGADDRRTRDQMVDLYGPLGPRLSYVATASAELAKHALNGFMAASVAFANEVAVIGERFGADAYEVEKILRIDPRVGPAAYVTAGAAFGGGTLARDVRYLQMLSQRAGLDSPMIDGVIAANNTHADWALRACESALVDLQGAHIAVLGLSYKVGTNSTRRSIAVHTVRGLLSAGALVTAHDPAVRALPRDLEGRIRMCPEPLETLTDAQAMILATPWPAYSQISTVDVVTRMRRPLVIDPAGALATPLAGTASIEYRRVGIGA